MRSAVRIKEQLQVCSSSLTANVCFSGQGRLFLWGCLLCAYTLIELINFFSFVLPATSGPCSTPNIFWKIFSMGLMETHISTYF